MFRLCCASEMMPRVYELLGHIWCRAESYDIIAGETCHPFEGLVVFLVGWAYVNRFYVVSGRILVRTLFCVSGKWKPNTRSGRRGAYLDRTSYVWMRIRHCCYTKHLFAGSRNSPRFAFGLVSLNLPFCLAGPGSLFQKLLGSAPSQNLFSSE